MPERMVVVGGVAAGMSAASQARRMRDASALEIVAFERSSYVSYSACGEPYYVGGYVSRIDDLVARTPAEFAARDIAVHTRHEVLAIDTQRGEVTVRDLDAGREERVGYDTLVYATGATTFRPPIEGMDLAGVHEMRTLNDALAVRRLVEAGARRAVVVGGGYIGVEMAEAFHRSGIPTTIVTASSSLLEPQFDPDMGDLVLQAARNMGIEVHTGRQVETLHGEDGHVTGVGCAAEADADAGDGQREFVGDVVVVLGLGSRPVVELAQDSGIPLGESGAVWVDDRQRTRVDGVWAAGDCAEATHRLTGQPVNYHLGTIANKQGRVAGINIGGGDIRFPGVLGTAITRLCDLEVARTGLTEAEARTAGLDYVTDTFSTTTTSGYWPDAERMRMKVLAERGSGRLLGAQIVGGPGAGKRIDTVAMALWNEMRVDDVSMVDLSYAPPFSGVWDPVLLGAWRLKGTLTS
ncbi:MAG: flavoprotein oxidoreductase [Dehalococcoidia bacterium]|nr:flavoprotein oxidoreductase [Dehalococcoidia bacterium]